MSTLVPHVFIVAQDDTGGRVGHQQRGLDTLLGVGGKEQRTPERGDAVEEGVEVEATALSGRPPVARTRSRRACIHVWAS